MPQQPADAKTRQRFAELVRSAYEGDAEWLDDLIQEAGYVHPEHGLQQRDLTAALPRLTRATLANWEADGLSSTARAGRQRYYPLVPFLRFLYDRGIKSGRPSEVTDGMKAHLAKDARYRALLRELAYFRERQALIDRAEFDEVLTALILETQAALLALPGQLSSRLEHQPAPICRNVLTTAITHLCNELEKARVPMPEAVRTDLRDLLRQLSEATSALRQRYLTDPASGPTPASAATGASSPASHTANGPKPTASSGRSKTAPSPARSRSRAASTSAPSTTPRASRTPRRSSS